MDAIWIELSKVISIFALAFFSFWPAIPAGLALGLSPVTVILTTSLSYSCGVGVTLLLRRAQGTPQRLREIARRYGVVGLGLAAPMTVGAQIGAALGLVLDVPPRRLFLGLALGALVWSVALTAASLLGWVGLQTVAG